MLQEKKRKYKINDSMRAVTDCLENLVALEDHAFLKTDRCKRCLQKHMLKAHGAAKDAIEQDHDQSRTKILERLEWRVRTLWKALNEYETNPTRINAQILGNKIRRVRLWIQKKFDISHIMAHIDPL